MRFKSQWRGYKTLFLRLSLTGNVQFFDFTPYATEYIAQIQEAVVQFYWYFFYIRVIFIKTIMLIAQMGNKMRR